MRRRGFLPRVSLVLGLVAALTACGGGGGGSSGTGSTTVPPASQAQEITISPPANRTPEAVGTIPDQALTEDGSALSLDVAPYFNDPDGDSLMYSARSGDTGIVRVNISGATITLIPVLPGNTTVTVTASDGHAEAVQTFPATIPEPNRVPEAVGSIPAQRLTEGGNTISLDVAQYFSDPDGDALTYTAESGNPGIVRVSSSGSMVTLTPVSPGNTTVTVTARDGHAEAVQAIDVTVRERRSSPPQSVSSPPSSSPPQEHGRSTCRVGLQLNRANTGCIHEMPFISFNISRYRHDNSVWVATFGGARRAGYSPGSACLGVNGFVAVRADDSETWTIRSMSGSATCGDYGF